MLVLVVARPALQLAEQLAEQLAAPVPAVRGVELPPLVHRTAMALAHRPLQLLLVALGQAAGAALQRRSTLVPLAQGLELLAEDSEDQAAPSRSTSATGPTPWRWSGGAATRPPRTAAATATSRATGERRMAAMVQAIVVQAIVVQLLLVELAAWASGLGPTAAALKLSWPHRSLVLPVQAAPAQQQQG